MKKQFCVTSSPISWSHFIKWNWFGIYGDMFFSASSCERILENIALVLISNNYTEVSDENGTILFLFYDLNDSMYKSEPTM